MPALGSLSWVCECFFTCLHRHNLANNNGAEGEKLTMGIRSQVKNRGEDLIEPVLNMHAPHSSTISPVILFAILQLSSQKNYSYVEKILRGIWHPPPPTLCLCLPVVSYGIIPICTCLSLWPNNTHLPACYAQLNSSLSGYVYIDKFLLGSFLVCTAYIVVTVSAYTSYIWLGMCLHC